MKNKGTRTKQALNRPVWGVMTGILSYLCMLSISYMTQVRGSAANFGKGINSIFLFGITAYLLVRFGRMCRTENRRERNLAAAGGVLLAFSYVYGKYLHYENTLFESPGQVLFMLLIVAGVSILTIPLFAFLLSGIMKASDWWQKKQSEKGREVSQVKYLFPKYWLLIFACYIPAFLCYWPVNFIYDAKYQLAEVINNAYKIHHPILHTLLMGETYKFGVSIGSASLGISIYTLIQMFLLSGAFASAVTYLYQKKAPKAVRIAAILFYAVFPMNSIFSVTATKDVLFAAFFLLFFVLSLRLCYEQERLTWQKGLAFAVTGVFMLLFRKNAVYALIAAIPFFLWMRKGKAEKVKLAVLLGITLLLANGMNEGIIRSVNATNDDSRRESMSVPLQQLARVASYRQGELEEDLYQEILLYIKEDSLIHYHPYLSDPIKNNANLPLLETNLPNFLKLWAKVGLKFPGEYIESFLANTMGYWYLGDTEYAISDGLAVYHSLIGTGEEIKKYNYFKPAGWVYDSLFFKGGYAKTPVLSTLFQGNFYFWLLIVFVFAAVFRKEYFKIAAVALPLAYFASCLLGPWAALRYVYCIIVCVPVLVMLCLAGKDKYSE